MVEPGVKLLVVGAVDGSQLGSQLEAAQAAGIPIIAYDRLLTNTKAVDLYMAYDNFQVGVLQGTALLEGLGKSGAASPWNIELISAPPKVVPADLLTPIIVTKDNVCTQYAPDTAAGKAAAEVCGS